MTSSQGLENTTTGILLEMQLFWQTLKNYQLWLYVAYNDLRSRYRRTIIGPFWLVLANSFTIIGMGVIWSLLFKIKLTEYFPKLTASMIVWIFISQSITEAGIVFTQQAGLIQNLPLPIFLHPLRIVSRNVIVFLHNLIIYLLVCLFFKVEFTIYSLLFIPFTLLVVLNIYSFSYVIGLIGARYRDLPQILISLMSVLIFVTPVMWDADMLGKYAIIVNFNPLSHFVFILKMPLLGQMPPLLSVIFVCVSGIIGFYVMLKLSSKYSHRIAYWV